MCDSSSNTTDIIEMIDLDKEEQYLDDYIKSNAENNDNNLSIAKEKVNGKGYSYTPTTSITDPDETVLSIISLEETDDQYADDDDTIETAKSNISNKEKKSESIMNEETEQVTDSACLPIVQKPRTKLKKLPSTKCRTKNYKNQQAKNHRDQKRRSDFSLNFRPSTNSTRTYTKSSASHRPIVPVKRSVRSTAGMRPSRLNDGESLPSSSLSSCNSKIKKSSAHRLTNKRNKSKPVKPSSKKKVSINTNTLKSAALLKRNSINDIVKDLDDSRKCPSNKSSKLYGNNNNTNNKYPYHINKQKIRVRSSSPESLTSQSDSDSSDLSQNSSNTTLNNDYGVFNSSFKPGLVLLSKAYIDKKVAANNQFQIASPSRSCTSDSTTISAKSDCSNSTFIKIQTSTSGRISRLPLKQSKQPHTTTFINTASVKYGTVDGVPTPRPTFTLAMLRENLRAKKLAWSLALLQNGTANTSSVSTTFPVKQSSQQDATSNQPESTNNGDTDSFAAPLPTSLSSTNMDFDNKTNDHDDDIQLIIPDDEIDELLEFIPDSLFELLFYLDKPGRCNFNSPSIDQYDYSARKRKK